MVFDYKCESCSSTEELDFPFGSVPPKQETCKKCGGTLLRIWTINPIVPEHMKATTDNSINYEKRNQVHKKHFGPAGRF